MKKIFRTDQQQYITPEEALRQLTGQPESAEAARRRMLQRFGLDREDGPAADAREAMIRRRERREK